MRLPNPLRQAMFALGLGVAAAVVAGAAMATPTPPPGSGCQLTESNTSANWQVSGYDPFSTSPLSSYQNVTFGNTGRTACTFTLLFQTVGQPYGLSGSGGQSLPYTLFDSTDNANVTPYAGATPTGGQIQLTISPGGQQVIQYAFTIDLTDLPTDGEFDQQLLLTAEQGTTILLERPIQLTLDVAPSAVIGLRGAYSTRGGSAFVELGDLVPGPATTLLQLSVQSTGGYRIDAQSANNGQLRLHDAPQWAIPYTMAIGDHTLDLASSASFTAPRLMTARQDLLPIAFIIGDTSQKRAGEYEDVITLSVTAQ